MRNGLALLPVISIFFLFSIVCLAPIHQPDLHSHLYFQNCTALLLDDKGLSLSVLFLFVLCVCLWVCAWFQAHLPPRTQWALYYLNPRNAADKLSSRQEHTLAHITNQSCRRLNWKEEPGARPSHFLLSFSLLILLYLSFERNTKA